MPVIGRDFANSMFDNRTVEVPLEVLRRLLEDSAVLSLSSDITAGCIETWTEHGASTFESAVRVSPDAPPAVARMLRRLLTDHQDTASLVYGMIAYRAREDGIPIAFTAGWLVSNIKWGGGDSSPLPALPHGGLDAFVVGATSEQAFKSL